MKPLEWIKKLDLSTAVPSWTLVHNRESRWPGDGEEYRTPVQWADPAVLRPINGPLGTVLHHPMRGGHVAWWWVPTGLAPAAGTTAFGSAEEAKHWAFTEAAARLTEEALAPDDRAYSAT